MHRGRIKFFAAAIAALVLALAIAGCGSDEDAASDKPVAAATGATGKSEAVTGGGASSTAGSTADDKADDTAKSDEKPDSTSTTKKSSGSSKPPEYGSKADKAKIKKAAATVAAAIDKGDVTKLCNDLYSSTYIEQLTQQGGCVQVTGKEVAAFSNYKVKVISVSFINDDDAQVVAKTSFDFNNTAKTSKPTLNFMREDGEWKYYIRTQ